MDSDVLKGHRGRFHDNSQAPHQGPPCQYQVTGGRVEDTPIDAVANHVVVWRLWVYVCVVGESQEWLDTVCVYVVFGQGTDCSHEHRVGQ